MTDQSSTAVQARVRAPCARHVAHDGQGGPMADQERLARIVRMAGPTAGRRVCDVACGAGCLAGAVAACAR